MMVAPDSHHAGGIVVLPHRTRRVEVVPRQVRLPQWIPGAVRAAFGADYPSSGSSVRRHGQGSGGGTQGAPLRARGPVRRPSCLSARDLNVQTPPGRTQGGHVRNAACRRLSARGGG
jgi:hypothetical protein